MYLDKILAQHREVASQDARSLSELIETARRIGSSRGFADRLAVDSQDSLAVIAEIKRRSPSRGVLGEDLKPDLIARDYQSAGASCISVLTDSDFFGGSVEDLQHARKATELPVLRKDFTVSLQDICDAKIMGADCILLIVAALTKSELLDFHQFAKELGLDVLVEIHDEPELEIAIEIESELVGVNQRDLKTFEVDQKRAVRMAAKIPSGVLRVAESGVRTRSDAQQLRDAGYDAILVGETLVTSADITKTLSELRV
ncbi:MAG: indole-3-glycerol phosphate synthase TrpC [Actinobacteria bacterium]|nr:indole-3-glycerol phosphate synthase TrpC [Actinomycetota bacterium]